MKCDALASPSEGVLLSAVGICKSFGGVVALSDVGLALHSGSILAVAGENGAGKSTLIKILTGVYQPDDGEIVIDGQPQKLTPLTARRMGITAVAQELSLLEHQSVAENISLGREPIARSRLVDVRAQRHQAAELLARLELQLSPDAMVRDLTLAQKQMVEIAKAMVTSPRVLILDEPTSGLREDDVEHLLNLIRQLRDGGTSILLVTHRMSEMFDCSDEIMVLKDGKHIGTVPTTQATEQSIVKMMVGRDLNTIFPDKALQVDKATEVMSVADFCIPGTLVHDVNLSIPAGAIVALAGLAGHGQTHLLEGIAGLRHAHGRITIAGHETGAFRSVATAVRNGVVLIPEDRKTQGLILPMTIGQNISLPTIRQRAVAGWINRVKEDLVATRAIHSVAIRPPEASVIAGQLSGGNQQKVVIGKWLVSDPKVVLCADPTRGIDVGTRQEIFALLRSLADRGMGVLMLSTDLTEVVGLSDIVYVMAEGQIITVLAGCEITEEAITRAAFQGAIALGGVKQ